MPTTLLVSVGRYGATLRWQCTYRLQRGIEYVQLEPVASPSAATSEHELVGGRSAKPLHLLLENSFKLRSRSYGDLSASRSKSYATIPPTGSLSSTTSWSCAVGGSRLDETRTFFTPMYDYGGCESFRRQNGGGSSARGRLERRRGRAKDREARAGAPRLASPAEPCSADLPTRKMFTDFGNEPLHYKHRLLYGVGQAGEAAEKQEGRACRPAAGHEEVQRRIEFA